MPRRRLPKRLLIAASGAGLIVIVVVVVVALIQPDGPFASGYGACGVPGSPAAPSEHEADLYYVTGSSLQATDLSATKVERTEVMSTSAGHGEAAVVSRTPRVVISSGTSADSGVQAIWSPSVNKAGSAIAYVTGPADLLGRLGGEGNIAVSSLDGQHRRMLTSHGGATDPVWSPDGSEIAFVEDGVILVMNSDGRQVHSVGGPDDVNTIAWSPSGACIAAAAGQTPSRIAIIDVRTKEYSWLDTPVADQYYPAWSPFGNSLVYSQGESGRLYLTDLSHNRTRLLADCPASDCTQNLWPAWSPDGSLIAFTRYTGYSEQIAIVAMAGGPIRQVTHGPAEYSLANWGPSVTSARAP
jgi:Tol biopolymer transport system component